ncbi:MAG: RNA 2',3'-cyclic phosphodiesterase [Acidobacteriota bacterium]
MRLFIAIDVPENVKKELLNVLRTLEKIWRGVKWVRPEGIHLTLKFLGEVDESKVESIASALREVAARYQPFCINVSSLGRFPENGKPRVVWCGIREEKGTLVKLAKEIESRMELAGFEREDRDFKPHVTIGRVKVPGRDAEGLQFLGKQKEIHFGSFEADRFHLIRSILLPDGARYEKIQEFVLGER